MAQVFWENKGFPSGKYMLDPIGEVELLYENRR
jgi:hypothetical protein